MITTDINIKISIDDDVDLTNPKGADRIKVDITHENCGNEKLDGLADDMAKIFNYVLQSYQSVLKEEFQKAEPAPIPRIESNDIKQ